MRELSMLKTLAEAPMTKQQGALSTSKFFNPLEDLFEDADEQHKIAVAALDACVEKLTKIQQQLESSVLTDLINDSGHPASESKNAKRAIAMVVARAEDASTSANNLKRFMSAANEQLLDLYQGLGMHYYDDDEDDK